MKYKHMQTLERTVEYLNPCSTVFNQTNSQVTQLTLSNTVDIDLMATIVDEVITDMRLGACAETITQTVQIVELGHGKKAAVRITVTTDQDAFL